jgi:hypothetical protein
MCAIIAHSHVSGKSSEGQPIPSPLLFLSHPAFCDIVPPMDFLTFLSIALPAVLQSWPLVVIYFLVRHRNSIDQLAGRIVSATWKGFSIVLWKQEIPQLPLLRELNVRETISLGTSPPPVRVITAITPGTGALSLIGANPSVSCQVRSTLA